jgi:N-acetylglucosamine kinase-like BadF-type ATPase
MNNNIFFIGIDSGGTKSEILIVDENNIVLHSKSDRAQHYSLHGRDKIVNHIKSIINISLKEKKLNLRNCKGICIGLAGVRDAKVKTQIKECLKKSLGYKNLIAESDSAIAFFGAFKKKDGLILICGTGSILLGKINNQLIRIGGWGWKIGDYGSGYEIGKNAIKNLVNEYDKGNKLCKLSIAIENKFSINKHNMLNRVYQNNFNFQNIVPLVLEYANKKDKVSEKIIDTAIEELLSHLKIFFSVTGYKKEIDIAFSGGILENENILSRNLKKRIKRDFRYINIVKKIHSPVEGAILLAKNKFDKK